jgi:hypothetical protein
MAFEPVRRKANGNTAWTKQASDAVNIRQPKEAAIAMCSKYVSPTEPGCSVNDRRATGSLPQADPGIIATLLREGFAIFAGFR